MFKHPSQFFWLSLVLLIVAIPVSAQGTGQATLTLTTTESFPTISANLNVYDGEGNFVHDLTSADVRAVEDGREIPITELTEQNNGAQFVVAINMGPVYAIKNTEGLSRYEVINQNLRAWIDGYPEQASDDLSLLTNEGLNQVHFNRPTDWLSSLESYQPEFDTSIPSLNVLADAIMVASDPPPQESMGRAVLLVTPLPGEDSLGILPSLLEMTKQSGVRVYVWVVSSEAYFDSERAERLNQFAAETGGKTFYFSGEETLPNVETYIDPLRYTYTLKYESQISSGDNHQVAARIDAPGLNVVSDPVEFEMSVQPPNPIFVSPPLEIQRAPTTPGVDAADENIGYEPEQQPLEILIEFPDGQPRPLERTTLYVDGEIADENLAPPFDRFSWDLSPYRAGGSHLIQVEAVDSLGLSKTSIEHEVRIEVQQPTQNVLVTLRQNRLVVIGVTVAVVVGILILFFLMRGQIQPKITGRLSKQPNGKQQKKTKPDVAKQQPKTTLPEKKVQKSRFSQWMDRFSWPRRERHLGGEAYLLATNGDDEEERIPLTQSELTFGCDPALATITLEDASVAPLHARIRKEGENNYALMDEGATAGTWINYEPISSDGRSLNHGDIIHIGRVLFRYRQSEALPLPKLKITPQEAP